ncbi:MAG: dienelactone hydrolase family protein [Alphaproteobacteria bacterium]|jgi:carboxymethylenebutenolidase|nr:dienelactone hydrolase family protein [Alphaproteobacteria bacterium]MDP6811851.1 dienelactone hydrolase family protein [Alphaproteobacteria bacterium]
MREFETEIRTADGVMDTFVCHPEEGGPRPAVILYMDAPGIREELRDMARRLGAVGYFVMLPNMYYRVGREGHYGYDLARIRDDDNERQKMFAVMQSLSNALVVADTEGLVAFARGTEAAAAGPMGCVGYCMSGQYVMAAGAAYPDDFAAIASYHGVGLITDQDDSPHLTADRIKGECYLGFASDDPYVPEAVLDALPGVLNEAGVDHRIEIYPDTEHGFVFPQRPVYRKAAAERHWETLFDLFSRRLRA